MIYKGEINLLPKKIQIRRLNKSYIKRMNHFINRFVLFFLLILIIEGIIFYIFWSINQTHLISNESSFDIGIKIEDEVKTVNSFLFEFESRLNNFEKWSKILDNIFEVTPNSVTLQNIKTDKEGNEIVIIGKSIKRSDMIEYQKKIESLNWAIKVVSPLSNFTVGKDETFEFRIQIKDPAI